MRAWKEWFRALPSAVDSQANSSVLSEGFTSCRSWEMAATLQAFLDGVLRSVVFTPLVCMGAVFLMVRDVAICLAALYAVVGMLVVTMGLLHLAGTQLGPIESLAIAVIIGVSVDYLIHLAWAYKNSLMTSRYYKSRASMLARANSISSAAMTTLCSVVPLLGSKIAPLRQFGLIFTFVTVVSFVFSIGFFNLLLMAAGPLKTRREALGASAAAGGDAGAGREGHDARNRDDATIQAAQLEMTEQAAWDASATALEASEFVV
jgi:putative flippase GtrA